MRPIYRCATRDPLLTLTLSAYSYLNELTGIDLIEKEDETLEDIVNDHEWCVNS